DDHAQLAGLGERLDDAGARGIAEAAVMISDAAAQQFRQVLADHLLLVHPQIERMWGRGQLTREIGRECLCALTTRREDEDGAKVVSERLRHEARPVTAHIGRYGAV